MKLKKGMTFLFCMLLMVTLWGCQNKQTEKKDTPKKEDSEIVKTGVIEKIQDSVYTIDGKQYDTKKISVNFNVHVKDEVKVTYMKSQEQKKITILKKLELVKCHYENELLKILNTMTLEEKVGQMFMVRCPVYNGVEVVQQYQPGGYIVFDANIQPFYRDQFVANNKAFQDSAKVPMLIGIDEEGGSVNRLSWYDNYRSTPFLSPQELYVQGGMDAIRNDTLEKANLLKSVGINVNFAPVADVSTNPNDFINARSFGKDGKATAEYVRNVVEVMKTNKMGSVLKHFPGYGSNVDTHTGSSYDTRNLESFRTNDFLPFVAGIAAGTDCVLVNHNTVSSMDANSPASLSAQVHDILRNELKFNGVVITDDLIMQAITNAYGDDNSAVMAVNAGNDMLISSSFEVQYQAVLNAVKEGTISEKRINESVMRILKWKHELGLV